MQHVDISLSISWWLVNTFSSIRFKFEFDLVCISSAWRISIWSLQVSGTCKNILKIKIPFQILFYPFRCMFKIMKGYKIFDFTPSGKGLKKTLVYSQLVMTCPDFMKIGVCFKTKLRFGKQRKWGVFLFVCFFCFPNIHLIATSKKWVFCLKKKKKIMNSQLEMKK